MRHAANLVVLLPLLCGCAYSYFDKVGAQHVIGLAHVRIPAPERAAGDVGMVRITTLGLALHRWALGTSVLLGYGDQGFATIPPDVCLPLALQSATDPGGDTDENTHAQPAR